MFESKIPGKTLIHSPPDGKSSTTEMHKLGCGWLSFGEIAVNPVLRKNRSRLVRKCPSPDFIDAQCVVDSRACLAERQATPSAPG